MILQPCCMQVLLSAGRPRATTHLEELHDHDQDIDGDGGGKLGCPVYRLLVMRCKVRELSSFYHTALAVGHNTAGITCSGFHARLHPCSINSQSC